MPNDDRQKQLSTRKINKQIDTLNNMVDKLYNTVYSTRVDNQKDLNRITDTIDDNMNDLLSSVNNQNASNLSSLIIRLQRKSGDSVRDLNKKMQSLISDGSVIDSINFENIQKYIQAENYQYDLILKYVPKLMEALEIMKDNVLSSDNFTKNFINVQGNQSNEQEQNVFNSRSRKLIDKYNIQELFEDMYITTAKYGEYFLYEVPYKQAFQRLVDRQQAPTLMKESKNALTASSKVIFESSRFNDFLSVSHMKKDNFDSDFLKGLSTESGKVILKMDPYGIIFSAIQEAEDATKLNYKVNSSSLSEAFNESVIREDDISSNNIHRGLGGGSLTYDTTPASMAHDGMIAPITGDTSIEGNQIRDMVGCVLYEIPRENIIPLYIGDYCIGYYYFEVVNDYIDKQVLTGNQFNSLTQTSEIKNTEVDKQTDMLVAAIANQISQAIDTKFINQNIDLKEEIYAILRYNDKFNATMGVNTINVSFIPASDIYHFYFRLDKDTHRGISDLQDSVTPAMIYALLYLTDVINKVSRSQDHRVYYVKQNIETNVARTMLNVINQIKKGNMGNSIPCV